MEINKRIKIIFIILVLITCGEIGYYLYYHSYINKNNLTFSFPKYNVGNLNKDQSTPDTTIYLLPPDTNSNRVDLYLLRLLGNLNRNHINFGYLNFQLKGVISDLDLNDGTLLYKNIKYKVLFAIKGDNDPKTNPYRYYFTEDVVKIAKIVQIDNTSENPISFSSLKIGDKVTMDIKLDIMKNVQDNIMELKISKL